MPLGGDYPPGKPFVLIAEKRSDGKFTIYDVSVTTERAVSLVIMASRKQRSDRSTHAAGH